MKSILKVILGVFFIASSGLAADKTAMNANWVCSTNASSSSVAADKAADDQMGKTAKSAKDAFAFASMNYRDCTKITCETK